MVGCEVSAHAYMIQMFIGDAIDPRVCLWLRD